VCVVEVLIRYGQYKHGMAWHGMVWYGMDYEGYFLFEAYVQGCL
jgi:hypothetical protein